MTEGALVPHQGPVPRRLAELADQLKREGGTGPHTGFVPWPMRGAHLIWTDLRAGRSVSVLELWRLLDDLEWWQSAPAAQLARELWSLSGMDSSVYDELVWRTLRAGEEESTSPANAAIAGLASLDARPEHREVLGWFTAKDGVDRFVRASARSLESPRRLLQRSGIPSNLRFARTAARAAVSHFVAHPARPGEAWVLGCLRDLDIASRDEAVEELLTGVTADAFVGLADLRKGIEAWYITGQSNWGRLSTLARQRIASWRSLAAWDDLERFTEKLTGYKVDDLPRLWGVRELSRKEQEARWALNRVAIWSNYAASFGEIQLFVHYEQVELLSRADGSVPENVEETDTQPFVRFSVKDLVVELHLVAKEEALFFRVRPGHTAWKSWGWGDDLDRTQDPAECVRVFGEDWQSSLYKAIESLGIPRNPGLKLFRGIPRTYLDAKTGMPR